MKWIMIGLIIIAAIIFIFCMKAKLVPSQICRVYKELVLGTLQRAALLLKIFIHPILVFQYVIGNICSLVLRFLSYVLNPCNLPVTIFPVTFFIISYHIVTVRPELFKAVIFAIITSLCAFIIMYNQRMFRNWTKPFYFSCYGYQYFFNLKRAAYEKLAHVDVKKKILPSDYADYRIQQAVIYFKELDELHDMAFTGKGKVKPEECKSRCMIGYNPYFKKELETLGLFNTDISIDILKKRKRELIKQNHPDNVRDDSEIKFYEEKCEDILNSYRVIMTELNRTCNQ